MFHYYKTKEYVNRYYIYVITMTIVINPIRVRCLRKGTGKVLQEFQIALFEDLQTVWKRHCSKPPDGQSPSGINMYVCRSCIHQMRNLRLKQFSSMLSSRILGYVTVTLRLSDDVWTISWTSFLWDQIEDKRAQMVKLRTKINDICFQYRDIVSIIK